MTEQQRAGSAIMLQGTASDVGKSIVTTALCRIFKQDGFKVAPFKSQNMALNSYVTPDGKEIGRAQGVQAEACGIAATTDMNPVLIKPTHDMHSQIVVHGKPFRHMSAKDYRTTFLPEARLLVTEAAERLKQEFDIVVMEGAGSPAEINLKHNDIVNMNMAEWAEAPVILVADIDRGGVFASIVGTLELLEPHERERVKGFIINKFRGDPTLLQPGLDWLEERTGKPVIGVLPYMHNLNIEAEDSVVLDHRDEMNHFTLRDLDIAVIRYPRISNFTDLDPLIAEPDVRVRYVEQAEDLGSPDAIMLPGSKSTLDDLQFMRDTGIAYAIKKHVEAGAKLVGICGGYQMLGQQLYDPEGVEAAAGMTEKGLGYLPIKTEFYAEKKTERVKGNVRCQAMPQRYDQLPIEGYEIHMGRSTIIPQTDEMEREGRTAAYHSPLFWLEGADGDFGDGCSTSDSSVWGTYLHGIFHNDCFRREWLNELREVKGLKPMETGIQVLSRREEAFDRLAEMTRQHLRMDFIYDMVGVNPPPK